MVAVAVEVGHIVGAEAGAQTAAVVDEAVCLLLKRMVTGKTRPNAAWAPQDCHMKAAVCDKIEET